MAHFSARAFMLTMLVSSLCLAVAPGGTNDDNLVNYEPPATTRRGGFAVGLTNSLGLASYRGYENTVVALADPRNEQTTGAELSSSFGLWLGGAVRDFLTLGLGFQSSSALTGDKPSFNPALLLHIEGYPLFFKGGAFRDLGVGLDAGLGTAVMFDQADTELKDPIAMGGSMSFLAFSAFWEPLQFWQFSAGPVLTYQHSFSQTFQINQGLLGFRMVFYGTQPREQRRSSRARHEGGGQTAQANAVGRDAFPPRL